MSRNYPIFLCVFTANKNYVKRDGAIQVRGVLACVAMRVAFAMCDRDADGLISIQEVHDTMTSLGHKLSHKQVKQIVRRVDTDRKFAFFTFGFAFVFSSSI